jgi:hypothetical protein
MRPSRYLVGGWVGWVKFVGWFGLVWSGQVGWLGFGEKNKRGGWRLTALSYTHAPALKLVGVRRQQLGVRDAVVAGAGAEHVPGG